MFPNNMDPRAIKGMMDKLGIKSKSIDSRKVVIYGNERDIVIEGAEVTLIEGQGMRSFQISGGRISEVDKSIVEISDEDVKLVQEQAGVDDPELVRKTLEDTKGDIAEAILRLKMTKPPS
jgi:nascent polypeptide-associated complex subunit alpha